MKLFSLLCVLALSLVREGTSTHLEICPCQEISYLVDDLVQQAVEHIQSDFELRIDTAISSINSSINTSNDTAFSILERRLTSTLRGLFEPIQIQLDRWPVTTDLPESSMTDLPPSSTTDLPPSSTTDLPPSSTTDLPPSSMTDLPLSSATDLDLQPSSTTDLPPSSTTDLPLSSTTDLPPSSTTDLPPSSTTDLPPSSTTDLPPSSTTDLPPSSTTDLPPSSTTDLPPSSTTDLPISIPGETADNPATSCKDLYDKYSASSGYYWTGEVGSAVRVYCNMDPTCGELVGVYTPNNTRNCTTNKPSRRQCDFY